MKIDRQKLLWKLHEEDYLWKLHKDIKEGLVGTLKNEYIMKKPMTSPYEKYSESLDIFIGLPIFHAMVDMMTANLLHSTGEKFVNIICNVLEKE